LDVAARAFRRAQELEVAPVVAGPERPRREGHVHLALGAAPEREAHELHAHQRARLAEHQLRLAAQPFRPVLLLDELHTHRQPPSTARGEMNSPLAACYLLPSV